MNANAASSETPFSIVRLSPATARKILSTSGYNGPWNDGYSNFFRKSEARMI